MLARRCCTRVAAAAAGRSGMSFAPVWSSRALSTQTEPTEAHPEEHAEHEPAPSPGSFDAIFASSSFARTGTTRGRVVPAKIVDMNKTHLKLELGTKFHSFIRIPGRASFAVGDEVLVMVRSTDYTEHVTGDAKAISIFEGDVSFVQPVGRPNSFYRS